MAKIIRLNSRSKFDALTENALLDFIRDERLNIIEKVKCSYPSLHEEKIKDIFQEVCISLVEKAHDENFKLTCSLFHFVYRCCWNKAEHEIRHPERSWQLPTDDIMRDENDENYESQPI